MSDPGSPNTELLEIQRENTRILLDIQKQIGTRVSSADMARHEALDENRFQTVESKIDGLVRKLYWMLGGAGVLGGLAKWLLM